MRHVAAGNTIEEYKFTEVFKITKRLEDTE